MSRRSNLLQRCIKLIEEAKGDFLSLEESALLADKETGQLREVDLVLRGKLNGHTLTVAFEVIARSRPADSTWVEQVLRKHECLPTDKLILVSQRGFRAPARRKAESNGAAAIDVSGGDRELRGFLQRVAYIRGVTARVMGVWRRDGQLQVIVPGTILEIGPSRAPAREQISYLVRLADMKRIVLERTEDREHVWLEAIPPGVVRRIEADNVAAELPGFSFAIRLERRDIQVKLSSLHYDGIDYIYGSFGSDEVPTHFVASADGSVFRIERVSERRPTKARVADSSAVR